MGYRTLFPYPLFPFRTSFGRLGAPFLHRVLRYRENLLPLKKGSCQAYLLLILSITASFTGPIPLSFFSKLTHDHKPTGKLASPQTGGVTWGSFSQIFLSSAAPLRKIEKIHRALSEICSLPNKNTGMTRVFTRLPSKNERPHPLPGPFPPGGSPGDGEDQALDLIRSHTRSQVNLPVNPPAVANPLAFRSPPFPDKLPVHARSNTPMVVSIPSWNVQHIPPFHFRAKIRRKGSSNERLPVDPIPSSRHTLTPRGHKSIRLSAAVVRVNLDPAPVSYCNRRPPIPAWVHRRKDIVWFAFLWPCPKKKRQRGKPIFGDTLFLPMGASAHPTFASRSKEPYNTTSFFWSDEEPSRHAGRLPKSNRFPENSD